MARHAKPINLHLLEGNKNRLTKKEINKRKKAEEAIQFKNDNIKPPTWLSNEGKKIFRKLVKEFEHNNILTNVDVHALSLFCDAYSEYIECTKIINNEGLMVSHTNKAGETNSIPHPLMTKKKQLFEQMNKIMGEFGLSPTARAKLAINLQVDKKEDSESNPFADRL